MNSVPHAEIITWRKQQRRYNPCGLSNDFKPFQNFSLKILLPLFEDLYSNSNKRLILV